MDTITTQKTIIEKIRLSESATFEYDETAITAAYKDQIENQPSLAIKILSIFGGLLATVAFIGFLFMAGLYDSDIGLSVFGIGFIITALVLNKVYNKLIIDTFSVSLYVTGGGLLAFGLFGLNVDENSIVVLISCIALGSLFIVRNYILSFISVLVIGGSLLFLITHNRSYNLIHLYVPFYTFLLTCVFLAEAKIMSMHKKIAELYNPLRIGILFSLLFGLIAIGKRGFIPVEQNQLWISSIIMIAVMLFIVYATLKINKITSAQGKGKIYFLTCLLLIPTLFSPSISGALIIILLSFLVNYKTGLAIGIISFIYFISQYYYDLNFTLLTKSIILLTFGIAFLLLYVLTAKTLSTNEKI